MSTSCARGARRHRGTWLGLLPLLAPVALIFGGGLALTLAQAWGWFSLVPVPTGWAAGFGPLLASPAAWLSLGFSLWVAFCSASLGVVLGTALAWGIWRLPDRWRPWAVVYKLSLILPHLSVAFVVLILCSQSGFLASVGHALGLVRVPADFPAILYEGHGLGLILAYAYKGAAFATLLVYAMLQRLDPRLLATARMLGAGRWQIFRQVVHPHVRPAMHTGFIILFLYSFGAFDIAYLLSESYPGMVALKVYNLYFKRDLAQRPLAMAILTVMFLFSLLFIHGYGQVTRRLASRERKL